jgi:hypothetical protein
MKQPQEFKSRRTVRGELLYSPDRGESITAPEEFKPIFANGSRVDDLAKALSLKPRG